MGLFAGRDTVLEGWLLKKKRKRMQGFAKRYFWLDKKGILSYSLSPKHPVRDSLFVGLASIGRSKKGRSFHIDSGRTVMHIKALSDSDFDSWSSAFKKFIQIEDEKLNARTATSRKNQQRMLMGADKDLPIDLMLAFQATAKMNKPLQDLWEILEDIKGATPSSSSSPGNERDNPHDHGKSPKDNKIAKMFKLGQHGKEPSSHESVTPPRNRIDASLLKQFQNALESLQAQHQSLLTALKVGPGTDDTPDTNAATMAATYASRNAIGFGGAGSILSKLSLRSDETDDVYEDAVGAEPGAVYDIDDEDEAYTSGAESPLESDVELEEEESFADEEGKGDKSSQMSVESAGSDATAKDTITRRQQLPAAVSGDAGGLLGVLRDNMGKDLSRISFPVTFNEPLSGLQRLCEEIEYTNLIRRAAATKDPIEKLCFVTAFAVSSYSSTKYRSSRKPFNPLLGETFECFRPDKGIDKFISEKVIHNPPTLACYAEGKNWEYLAHSGAKQKFWGRTFEIIPSGSTRLTLKNTQEVFTWTKPSSFIRNLMGGKRYLEHVGEMKVKNENTGAYAIVSFKEGGGMFSGPESRNKLEGKVYDDRGKVACELSGKWDESLSRKTGPDNYQILFTVSEFPKDVEKYYGFPTFTVQLNEITDDIKDVIPPTDSRLRPDQRFLEEGKIDQAEKKKSELEERQREKRREHGEAKPRWFEEKDGKWVYKGGYEERREKREWEDPKIF